LIHAAVGSGGGTGTPSGPIREGLELGLGEGVVVGDVGPGMRGHHAQGGRQQGHRLGGHRRAAAGMDDALIGADVLALATLGDEHLGPDLGRRQIDESL